MAAQKPRNSGVIGRKQDPATHWARHNALLLSVERPFAKAVQKEKNRYIRACIPGIVRNRLVPEIETEIHRKNMQAIFQTYYARIIRDFNRDTEDALRIEVKSAYWEYLLSVWITTWGASKAMQTANTTRQDIQNALIAALESTEAIPEDRLVQRILLVRGLSVWRAENIARTETHQAAMYASKETAKRIAIDNDLEIKKKWIPVEDSRTRDWHASMANYPAIAMDAYFIVDGERMDRPGDPNASAHNVCRCRCAMIYE